MITAIPTAGVSAARMASAFEAPRASGDVSGGFAAFLREVWEGQEKMGAAMKEAFSGRKLTGVEMLAVQAGIYRHATELDLAARVVEKVSAGVRQTMNTQVG